MTTWTHLVLDLPPEREAAGVAFWTAALGWPLGPPWAEAPELATFTPGAGDAYVHRQLVDGPAGVHLDLEVADRKESTDRLLSLGATLVRRAAHWTTLATPGGFAFCLLDEAVHAGRPEPLSTPVGGRSRLVQLCLDSRGASHDADVAFWRAATGWRWVEMTSPEFTGKLYPAAGSPVQLLLQRLGDDDPGPARAHLDLGADDIEAETVRLEALGAIRLHSGDGWIALRDPAGLPFCVTENPVSTP